MNNILICFTPLHILISQRILETENIDDFVLIYFYSIDTPKNQYYFKQLGSKAKAAHYLKKSNSIKDFLAISKQLLLLKKRFRCFGNAYSGNLKTSYSRFVLWLLNPKYIYSMDDGIGNIDAGEGYFLSVKENSLSKLFFSLLGRRFLYKNVREHMVQNYTIYEYPNVFKRSKYLSLFKELPLKHGRKKTKQLTVFLTGALSADGRNAILPGDLEMQFYKEIFKRYKIDLVIKHPRQNIWDIVGSPPVSDSVEIAEHQILNLMQDHSVTVIGTFHCTVLVNLPAKIKRTNIITDSKHLSSGLNEFFETIAIETIHISI